MIQVDEKKRAALKLTREEKLMLKGIATQAAMPKRQDIEKYSRVATLK